MRPIKFRAWDMYEKRMVYKKLFDRNWYYTPSNDQGGCHTAYECKTHKEANHSDVMQFTGLLDKNGKEIYEEDILEFVEDHEPGCGCDHCFPYRSGEKVKVVWFEGTFGLLPANYEIKENICEQCAGYIGLMSPNHEIPIGGFTKIIGNIYENPELLK